MEISKENFERIISMVYQRGRVMPINFISGNDIEKTIHDAHEWLSKAQPQDSPDKEMTHGSVAGKITDNIFNSMVKNKSG